MHPRNPYKKPLDFEALAKVYEPLKDHLKRRKDGFVIDSWRDPRSQRHAIVAAANLLKGSYLCYFVK